MLRTLKLTTEKEFGIVKIYKYKIKLFLKYFFVSLDNPPTHYGVFTARPLLSFLLHKAVSSTSTISPIPPSFTIFLGKINLLITGITSFIAFYFKIYSCLYRLIMVCCLHSYIIIIILKNSDF